MLDGNGLSERVSLNPQQASVTSSCISFEVPRSKRSLVLLILMAMLSNNPGLLHFYGFLIDKFILDYKMLLGCLQQRNLLEAFFYVHPLQ